jgi:hypothetical protein
MSLQISHIAVDSRDAFAQSRWWGAVLGFAEDPADPNQPGHEECLILSADGRERLLFIEVAEPKQVKNRLHLDLRPTGTLAGELNRLIGLGAVLVADLRTPERGWVTLADPEGNEFCILRGEEEVPDPYAHLGV